MIYVRVIQVFESNYQGDAYLTALDSRGLMWTAKCQGFPLTWDRINSPPGCIGETNECDDPRYQCPAQPKGDAE